jgi:hypothetical protein
VQALPNLFCGLKLPINKTYDVSPKRTYWIKTKRETSMKVNIRKPLIISEKLKNNSTYITIIAEMFSTPWWQTIKMEIKKDMNCEESRWEMTKLYMYNQQRERFEIITPLYSYILHDAIIEETFKVLEQVEEKRA